MHIIPSTDAAANAKERFSPFWLREAGIFFPSFLPFHSQPVQKKKGKEWGDQTSGVTISISSIC